MKTRRNVSSRVASLLHRRTQAAARRASLQLVAKSDRTSGMAQSRLRLGEQMRRERRQQVQPPAAGGRQQEGGGQDGVRRPEHRGGQRGKPEDEPDVRTGIVGQRDCQQTPSFVSLNLHGYVWRPTPCPANSIRLRSRFVQQACRAAALRSVGLTMWSRSKIDQRLPAADDGPPKCPAAKTSLNLWGGVRTRTPGGAALRR